MPSILLDHRIDEAAVSPTDTPNHRWSRRRPAQPTVETVVANATRSTKPAPRRPYAGIGGDVIAELRADEVQQFDAAAVRALLATPMYDPAEDPQPITALLERARYVMGTRDRTWREIFEEDRVRREDLVAARWIDAAIGNEMTETAQDVVAAVPAVLAAGTSLTADVIGLELSVLDELLAPPLPGTDWAATLLCVLPSHVVARMKGWVA